MFNLQNTKFGCLDGQYYAFVETPFVGKWGRHCFTFGLGYDNRPFDVVFDDLNLAWELATDGEPVHTWGDWWSVANKVCELNGYTRIRSY